MVRATTNARSRVYAAPILNQCCAFESTKSFFNSIDPCRTHSRVLALNWRTIEWRHNSRPLGTNANRARFKGMDALSSWPRNRLLRALPSRDLKRLMPELKRIRCQYRQILMDDDSSLDHVFFPDSGVVSVVAVYSDGSIIEMATIGREGFTDVQAAFGAKTSSARLLVQIQGERSQDVARGVHTSDGVDAVLPRSHERLRPGLSCAGHGVSSVQRYAQPQEAPGALVAHDE